MKILMFGKTGQVATCMQRLADNDVIIYAFGRSEVDLTRTGACAAAINNSDADIVINAAAYTAVDRAENDQVTADLVNHLAVAEMAEAAKAKKIPFLHISTDYVFPGDGASPWKPDDSTGPLGVYGHTKRDGERAVARCGGQFAILRTSWVFSEYGANFVKTMLRLGKERDSLSIVGDQIGGPTSAADIANTVLVMARKLIETPHLSGIWHLSGAPDVSWAEFASEIFAQSGSEVAISRIPTKDYPTPATRPLNSRLDCSSLKTDFGISRPNWRESLRLVLIELGELQ